MTSTVESTITCRRGLHARRRRVCRLRGQDRTGAPFAFDRLGVRVPAILVSPWVPKNVVIPGPNQKNGASLTTLPSPPP